MKKLLLALCFVFISFEANSEVVKFSCNFTRGAMLENPPWNRGVTKSWEYLESRGSFFYLDFENKVSKILFRSLKIVQNYLTRSFTQPSLESGTI